MLFKLVTLLGLAVSAAAVEVSRDTHPIAILHKSAHQVGQAADVVSRDTHPIAILHKLAAAVEVSAADVVSNIDRLTTLTMIASSVTHYVVHVHNPIRVRQMVVVAIVSIGTRGTLDQDSMTGHPCGSLTKRYAKPIAGRAALEQRHNTTYSSKEQTEVANAYANLVNETQVLKATLVDKHHTIVLHELAHQVGQALNSTFGVLDAVTDLIMTAVPAKIDVMMKEKSLLDESYSSIIDLYVNGPS